MFRKKKKDALSIIRELFQKMDERGEIEEREALMSIFSMLRGPDTSYGRIPLAKSYSFLARKLVYGDNFLIPGDYHQALIDSLGETPSHYVGHVRQFVNAMSTLNLVVPKSMYLTLKERWDIKKRARDKRSLFVPVGHWGLPNH